METSQPLLNRVLILSASAGAGHVRAGQAMEKAFKLSGTAKEVQHVDALEYTNPVLRNIYSRGYIDMVNKAPTVLGILYDTADVPWKDEGQRLAFDRLNTMPLAKLLRDYDADLVVCTHFLPAEIISWLLCKKKIDSRQAVVVTDFDMHAMWLCRHFDEYFVALDETREHLRKLGVAPERVTVSGIPIDPVFAERKGKAEMRAKYGLKQELPTILLSAGGFGVGPVQDILYSLKDMHNKCQVLALCGRNPELKEKLDYVSQRDFADSNVIIKPVGYTDKMDELMSASDILLGKPGGLTSSEALAKGLVFTIVNPIPGQEERNSDHLLEEGVAIRCNNLPALAFKIDRLLDDKEKFLQMQENSLAMGHPNAAMEIVQKLIKAEFSGTVNVHGEHFCESPLLRLVKPVQRLAAANRERAKELRTTNSKRGARAVVRMRKLFKRKARNTSTS